MVLLLDHLLGELSSAMAEAGVPTVVLKGPAVASTFYPDRAWRSYGDLDLLVAAADWRGACEVLVRLGFRRIIPEPRPGFDERFGKGASFEDARKLQVDLHRTLAMGPFGLWIDPGALLASTTDFPMRGGPLRRLDDPSTLIHACIHAALGRQYAAAGSAAGCPPGGVVRSDRLGRVRRPHGRLAADRSGRARDAHRERDPAASRCRRMLPRSGGRRSGRSSGAPSSRTPPTGSDREGPSWPPCGRSPASVRGLPTSGRCSSRIDASSRRRDVRERSDAGGWCRSGGRQPAFGGSRRRAGVVRVEASWRSAPRSRAQRGGDTDGPKRDARDAGIADATISTRRVRLAFP